jgi:hypothetical protein
MFATIKSISPSKALTGAPLNLTVAYEAGGGNLVTVVFSFVRVMLPDGTIIDGPSHTNRAGGTDKYSDTLALGPMPAEDMPLSVQLMADTSGWLPLRDYEVVEEYTHIVKASTTPTSGGLNLTEWFKQNGLWLGVGVVALASVVVLRKGIKGSAK